MPAPLVYRFLSSRDEADAMGAMPVLSVPLQSRDENGAMASTVSAPPSLLRSSHDSSTALQILFNPRMNGAMNGVHQPKAERDPDYG